MRLGDLDALKEELFIKFGNQLPNGLFDEIDNAPTVPQVTVFAETADEKAVADLKAELQSVIESRQKDEWIPVSERLPQLPQDRDWYLGVFREPDTGYIIDLPFVCDYVGYPTEGTTNDAWILRGLTDIDNPSKYYKNLECVAWRPLPEPYKERR